MTMMKNKRFLGGFQVRFTLVLILCMLFTGAMCDFLVYKFALNSQFADMRGKLMLIAQTASLMVDPDMLMLVPLNRDGVNSPAYKIIAQKLERIKTVNPPIKYIYTMSKTDQDGVYQFVVDPEPVTKKGKKTLTSYPGDTYDGARFPEMSKAFNRPTADKKLGTDEWGAILSGYAPIRDSSGKAVAILGVDIMADDVYLTQKKVHQRAFFVLFLGIVFSMVIGMFISKRITGPLEKLVEGTRHIAEGDLQYHVEARGSDEVRELAASFNQMAQNLRESRKRVLSYFYDVVQSLVRIIEARDHYTRGHSENVAGYAEKIALKMGFSKEKVELVKEIALLHDIGKFAIQENILNKSEKLSEEEWQIIRKHPVIGEDILKPIVLNDEMLAMIRGHHERYDGKGYPDKLNGKNINIFAAILTVADAYDAMTSQRAYRLAKSKQEAMDELKKNSGSQFNPEVVEVFLKILQETT